MLKSRLLKQNPCDVDRLFRRIKQFGHHAPQAGGVCAVEMALMDLAGRAYGVSAYQLAGGRFRDRVLCYCDTPSVDDGREMGRRLQRRGHLPEGGLRRPLRPLRHRRHRDLASSGGILETKKIGDAAQDAGIAMALHMAMSPVAAMASVQAAATENFLVSVGLAHKRNLATTDQCPISFGLIPIDGESLGG